jgi:CRP/FNR family transcriptional regulator, cyclic AMP receptor protein
VDPNDIVAFLRSQPLFGDLRQSELRQLATTAHRHTFDAETYIFRQGERGATCHIILRGKVRVFVIGEDGRELCVRLLGPGEIIGEMALFEKAPRSASVVTLEPTETVEIGRDALLHAIRHSPSIAVHLLRALSARLRHTNEDAEWLASLPVVERLYLQLQRLAEWSGTPTADGIRITPPMTQQELAALVGTSRESVNRALMRLRQQDKVRLEGGWIILLDPPN